MPDTEEVKTMNNDEAKALERSQKWPIRNLRLSQRVRPNSHSWLDAERRMSIKGLAMILAGVIDARWGVCINGIAG